MSSVLKVRLKPKIQHKNTCTMNIIAAVHFVLCIFIECVWRLCEFNEFPPKKNKIKIMLPNYLWHQKHNYNKLLTCFPLFPGRPVGPLFPGVPGSPLGPISPCTTNLISVNENVCLNMLHFWKNKMKIAAGTDFLSKHSWEPHCTLWTENSRL